MGKKFSPSAGVGAYLPRSVHGKKVAAGLEGRRIRFFTYTSFSGCLRNGDYYSRLCDSCRLNCLLPYANLLGTKASTRLLRPQQDPKTQRNPSQQSSNLQAHLKMEARGRRVDVPKRSHTFILQATGLSRFEIAPSMHAATHYSSDHKGSPKDRVQRYIRLEIGSDQNKLDQRKALSYDCPVSLPCCEYKKAASIPSSSRKKENQPFLNPSSHRRILNIVVPTLYHNFFTK